MYGYFTKLLAWGVSKQKKFFLSFTYKLTWFFAQAFVNICWLRRVKQLKRAQFKTKI